MTRRGGNRGPTLPYVDRAGEMRPGEELDAARLAAYIADVLPDWTGPLSIRQFPAGHSNLTYLVRSGERELVLRRPPPGARIKTAHDMGREFRILSGLQDVYPKVPRPLAYCDDAAVLGAPFYLMQRVRGVILRGQRLPKGLSLSAERMRRLSSLLIDQLAGLHAVDLKATGLADEGRPEGFVERQVRGWSERYFKAKTDQVDEVEEVASWLARHAPPESGAALVHGDFKYDNLVLDPVRLDSVVAILDWEMATVGDPLLDLGTTLGYWIDPDDSPEHRMLPLGPTLLEGNLTRRELLAAYAEARGRPLPDMLFYYVFGLFKIAVIAQQIYARFKAGRTQDPRFASMILGVRVLGQSAVRALERGRIHA